jgi:hypothetical protein
MMAFFDKTSRTATTGACPPSGPRDAGTKYHPRTETIRLPAGSIVSIARFEPPLEPINLSKARFNKALLFALFVNFICWGFILLAGRALAAVFL